MIHNNEKEFRKYLPDDPQKEKQFVNELVKIQDSSGRNILHQATIFSAYSILPILLKHVSPETKQQKDSFGMDMLELCCIGEGVNLNLHSNEDRDVGLVSDLKSEEAYIEIGKIETPRYKTAKLLLKDGSSSL